MSVGSRIKSEVQARDLTMPELVKRVQAAGWEDFTQSTASKIASDRRSVTVEECAAIAHALGVSPSYLAGYSPRP